MQQPDLLGPDAQMQGHLLNDALDQPRREAHPSAQGRLLHSLAQFLRIQRPYD